ncbi:hypothetical protein pVa21_053 [Vibrio phage pVa-21]|nr:hypothetical protein pVa21_053 [Vibrio phage pVa-21]
MEITIAEVGLVIAVIYGLFVTFLLYLKDKKYQRNRLTLCTVKSELRSLFKPFNLSHPDVDVLSAFSHMSDGRFVAMGGYGLDIRSVLKDADIWLDSHLYVASVIADDRAAPTAIAYGYLTGVKTMYVEVYVVDPSIKYWSDANETDILRRVASALELDHIYSNSFTKVPGGKHPKERAANFAKHVMDLRQNITTNIKYTLHRG